MKKHILPMLSLALAVLLFAVLCVLLFLRARGDPAETSVPSVTEPPGEIDPVRGEEPPGRDGAVVFFGDSLTSGGKWQAWFPEQKVVNLGVSGDTVSDMTRRTDAIRSIEPAKVFVLAGINSLMNLPPDTVLEQYGEMMDRIRAAAPEAELYILSVLPIGRAWENDTCGNDDIVRFNTELEALAERIGAVYIDIHSLYVRDGCLDESLTYDGVHLTEEGYEPWIGAVRSYAE